MATVETHQFEAWHDLTCRNLSLTECDRISADQFQGRLANRTFARAEICEIASHDLQFTRGPSEIRRDFCDDYLVTLLLEGRMQLRQHDREASVSGGDIVIHDQAQPFCLKYAGKYEAILLKVPRPLLAARLSRPDLAIANPVRGTSRLGAFVRTVLSEACQIDWRSDGLTTERLCLSVIDVVAAAIESETCGRLDYAGNKMLKRVKEYMIRHLSDPGLDTETIAKAHGIGRRSLNRLFSGEGVTPMKWLWQQRLAACYTGLREGDFAYVTDAAFAFGFSELSHFSRSFKKSFGLSPHDVLAASRNGRDLLTQ
jgi:AraC-like DNA-binding protein